MKSACQVDLEGPGRVSPSLLACEAMAGSAVAGSAAATRRTAVILCATAGFLAYIDRVNISVAIVEMGQDLGWTLQQRGVVLASFFYGYILSQVRLWGSEGGGRRRQCGVGGTA